MQRTNWYFVTKIVLTYYEKKLFQLSRKTFEIQGWLPRICKIFEITMTIYSNSEQLLVTECFFLICSSRFLISNKLEQFKFKLEKFIGKHAGKVRIVQNSTAIPPYILQQAYIICLCRSPIFYWWQYITKPFGGLSVEHNKTITKIFTSWWWWALFSFDILVVWC